MKRILVAGLAILGLVAVALVLIAHPTGSWAALAAVPFFIGYTHSSLSDQTDTKSEFPSQLLTGAGGAQSGTTIDMQGYDAVLFDLSIGVITGLGALDAWAQYGNNANASDMANITGGAITQVLTANQNSIVEVSVYRPSKRYVRLQFNQTVNNVQVGCIAKLFRRSGINPGANVGQPAQSPLQIVKLLEP